MAHLTPDQPIPDWRLNANLPLSDLHAKFWGVDIHEDEVKWLTTQPEGQRMDVDGSEVGPGCFALDLKIRKLLVSRLWIRKDYIRIYDECKDYYESPPDGVPRPRSVVVTGQPGIGKTFWIIYAVRRRLGERKPFLWHYVNTWYLFLESGVYKAPQEATFSIFDPYIWAFVDADYSTAIPPLALEPVLFTIFTSSPQRERWKRLEKTTICMTFIMNPWTWDEIYQAAIVHGLSLDQLMQAEQVFEEHGPTARLCLDFVSNPALLLSHKSRVSNQISELSLQSLLEITKMSRDIQLDLSHRVILLRRRHVTNFQEFVLEPITQAVARQLTLRLMQLERISQLLAYRHLERVSESRPMAGFVFESMAQVQFQKVIDLDLVPMVELLPDDRPRNALWTSVPSSIAPDLVAITTIFIQCSPEGTVQYEGSVLNEFQPDVYYMPRASNQVGFDAFILVNQTLYIFQFCIADSHPIKAGIMDFFSQPNLKDKLQGMEWRFVFIIPRGETILCPRSRGDKIDEFWDRVSMFTAVFDPESIVEGN